MDLRQLRYLVAIADAGTFVGAAEALRVAQPALSRQINDLERKLGVDLFETGARRATLTAAGETAVRLARHVIRDTQRAVSRARLSNSGLVGEVTLLAGPLPVQSGLAARLVARLKGKFPGISLRVQEEYGAKQWNDIMDGRADIGLGLEPIEMPGLLSETQYTSIVDVVIVAPTHPLANHASVTVADLAAHPIVGLGPIGAETTKIRMAFEAEAKKLKLKPPPVTAVMTLESVLMHVHAAHCWTFMVEELAARLPGVVMIPVVDFRVPFRTARIWRKADTRPAVHTVLNELRQMGLEERDAVPVAGPGKAKPATVAEGVLPLRLELRHLRSFAKVAKAGTLGRAAEALDITQPALSRQMRDLEYDVGVQLLDRNARGIELTPAGDVFLGDVDGVLKVADHLAKEVRRAKRGATSECVIAAVPHPRLDRVLGHSLGRIRERDARVQVTIESIPSPKHAEALRKSEIDIAIGHIFPVPMPSGDGLLRQKLLDDAICTALVAENHPLASVPSILAANLSEIPFLWGDRRFFTRFYDVIMQSFVDVGLRPRIEATYDGLQTVWNFVAQGQGWTLGWETHLKEPPAGTKAVPLRDFRLPWGVELVYRRDESRDAILGVIDAIADSAMLLEGAATSLVTADSALRSE